MKINVPPGKARERIDVYLTHHVENATRTKVREGIDAGFVVVNGKPVKASYKVSPGDVIEITLPKPPAPDVLPENIPLDIPFEDEYLLVVNKPAGMVTHPAYAHYTGTLVNALLYHCKKSLSTLNDVTRPGIVHRLDKDTSGIMVIAKTDAVHAKLAKQFSDRTIDREYWAIVWGRFSDGKKENTSGIIEAALGRSKSDRKKIAVSEEGKAAITEYEVLEEFNYLSLIKLKLRTGRTHQIRVHLHHIGHPVFGDPTYGGRRIAWGSTEKKKKEEVHEFLGGLDRQALHAKTIGFVHPVTKKKLKFESELPDDMQQILTMLRIRR
ncbi:MAG TPA: RluA family pseudouridine synthase [Bacteroidota bacterium]|nr:RluA family pseudouridine synthase [Bacteroidota bacterium]